MLVIESFLRDRDGTMVPVAQATEPPPDPRHVDGAIRLVVEHKPVLDETLWDLVDQLWAYLADMLDTLAETGSASTYFPDSPVHLELTRVSGDRVRVSVTGIPKPRTATTGEREFTTAVRAAGAAFFTEMSRINPAESDFYRQYQRRLSD
jgi:hypothetical protein